MTLVVLFHHVRHRQFKVLYLDYVRRHLRAEFPCLPRYSCIVELMPRCTAPMAVLFELLKERCDGLSILYSTPLAVCDNLRISRHQVCRHLAARCKTST